MDNEEYDIDHDWDEIPFNEEVQLVSDENPLALLHETFVRSAVAHAAILFAQQNFDKWLEYMATRNWSEDKRSKDDMAADLVDAEQFYDFTCKTTSDLIDAVEGPFTAPFN